jgi:hypothetical protein
MRYSKLEQVSLTFVILAPIFVLLQVALAFYLWPLNRFQPANA